MGLCSGDKKLGAIDLCLDYRASQRSTENQGTIVKIVEMSLNFH